MPPKPETEADIDTSPQQQVAESLADYLRSSVVVCSYVAAPDRIVVHNDDETWKLLGCRINGKFYEPPLDAD